MTQFSRSQLRSGSVDTRALALSLCMPVGFLELVNPALGGVDDLKAATATVAAIVVLGPSDLKSAGLTKLTAAGCPARAITFTTAGTTEAHAPATATVVGLDANGDEITEEVDLSQTAATVTSDTCFSDITSITYPAADGTSATVAIGIGAKVAFPHKAALRAGVVNVLNEMEGGAVPTRGTFTAPASSLPNGAYTANSAFDGTKDFVVTYEIDASAFGL